MRLGILARMDQGGLAWQTSALVRMLSPAKVMLIDSRPFNGPDVKQYPERFDRYEQMRVEGFPTDEQCHGFLDGLTHVITCETSYNRELYAEAERRGVKTFEQYNFEFQEALIKPDLPLPTKFLAPSTWNLDVMRQRFGDRVVHLPPPTFPSDFERPREANLARRGKRRFLCVVGKPATGDRNGVMLLMHAMQRSRGSYELVVKSQTAIPRLLNDPRITWDSSAPEDRAELYEGFDLMVYPRRYGGLALPLNEGLASALPVLMPNVAPNDSILPADWLIPGAFNGGFTARVPIQYFNVNVGVLASQLDAWAAMPDETLTWHKTRAFELSKQFSPEVLKPKYDEVLA